jgi:RimJ/RimL family protein N-acetyltransferase
MSGKKDRMKVLDTERLTLVPLTEAHLPVTLAWRNEDDARIWFGHSDVVSDGTHRSWFSRYIELDNDFFYMALQKRSLVPVAHGALFNVDFARKTGELGRVLVGNPSNRRCGYAMEVVTALLGFGFRELGLKVIELNVLHHNTRAIALYRKAGFQSKTEDGAMLPMWKPAP